MPFDERSFPITETAVERRHRYQVSAWLFGVSFMIWCMVILGGATRLTDSGLSIMEWAPFSGALPPVSHAEWERLFALYKGIAQFKLKYPDMDLAGFQGIFWLEWVHRLWGRLMILALVGPMLWFAWRGVIGRAMVARLLGFLALGALQGAVGWFMVASGFEAETMSVSPYRLVLHLCLALALFAGIFWTALSVARPMDFAGAGGRTLRWLACVATLLVGLTIVAGGFMAGTHAGLIYDSFPLMDGRLIPAGYFDGHSWLRNMAENVTAVQFDHRVLASLAALATLVTVAWGFWPSPQRRLPRAARLPLACMGALLLVQYGLGVSTLLSHVAIALAVAHQANSVLLLAAALGVTHALRE